MLAPALAERQNAPARVSAPPRAVLTLDDQRGGYVAVVPPGAYTGTVAWPHRDHFIRAVSDGIRSSQWRHRLKLTDKDTISPDTLMRVIKAEARYADTATGRNITVSIDTIAEAAHCSTAVVTRAHRIMRRVLGIQAEAVAGRLLTKDERLNVWERGLRQRGVPSVRAFTVPVWLQPYLENVRRAQPCGPHVSSATQPRQRPESNKTTARTTNLVSRKRSTKAARGACQSSDKGHRRLATGEQLARGIADLLPWRHRIQPRRLAAHFAEAEQLGWTPHDWIAAADQLMRTLGWNSPVSPRKPGGYLVWLNNHIDIYDYTPPPPTPPWCGSCHRQTRLLELPDGRLQRCQQCHPLAWPRSS